MSEQKPPANDGMGGWHVEVHGDVGAMGPNAQGTVNKQTYNMGSQPIDMKAFQESLLELHQALGSANLPGLTGIKAQTAVGHALETTEKQDVQPSAVKEHLEQIGAALQQANTTIEQGSKLAASLQKIAKIAAPFIGVGAHVVAGWFGIPLP